jgi:hypothetical protein
MPKPYQKGNQQQQQQPICVCLNTTAATATNKKNNQNNNNNSNSTNGGGNTGINVYTIIYNTLWTTGVSTAISLLTGKLMNNCFAFMGYCVQQGSLVPWSSSTTTASSTTSIKSSDSDNYDSHHDTTTTTKLISHDNDSNQQMPLRVQFLLADLHLLPCLTTTSCNATANNYALPTLAKVYWKPRHEPCDSKTEDSDDKQCLGHGGNSYYKHGKKGKANRVRQARLGNLLRVDSFPTLLAFQTTRTTASSCNQHNKLYTVCCVNVDQKYLLGLVSNVTAQILNNTATNADYFPIALLQDAESQGNVLYPFERPVKAATTIIQHPGIQREAVLIFEQSNFCPAALPNHHQESTSYRSNFDCQVFFRACFPKVAMTLVAVNYYAVVC